jgi:hypothetical protein
MFQVLFVWLVGRWKSQVRTMPIRTRILFKTLVRTHSLCTVLNTVYINVARDLQVGYSETIFAYVFYITKSITSKYSVFSVKDRCWGTERCMVLSERECVCLFLISITYCCFVCL